MVNKVKQIGSGYIVQIKADLAGFWQQAGFILKYQRWPIVMHAVECFQRLNHDAEVNENWTPIT